MADLQLRCLICLCLALLVVAPACRAQEPAPPAAAGPVPLVAMFPPGQDNGRCFRDLFEKPDAWKQTRASISILGYADHVLHTQFKDEELKVWLPRLQEWGIKLELEVGAVKPWGPTGEKCFAAETPMWERFEKLGGKVHSIAMDEPLCCVRNDLKKPDEYAVQETAAFIAQVRKRYPDMLVGDVEPAPFLSTPDAIKWIDALQAKLAELGVRGMDFFRLDVDWLHFVNGNHSWRDILALEQYCRSKKLPFGLIYWAADYPAAAQKGLADDSTWYTEIMRQGYDYSYVGGKPDQYVIESWIGAPSQSVPETDQWTFTRSVLDFTRRFVRKTN